MLEKAKEEIYNVLVSGIVGVNKECEYYPCHFLGQDCTWCYCPFYPCQDNKTGGKYVNSKKSGNKVWSCKDCHWIHEKDIPQKVLKQLKSNENWTENTEAKKIRLDILGEKE